MTSNLSSARGDAVVRADGAPFPEGPLTTNRYDGSTPKNRAWARDLKEPTNPEAGFLHPRRCELCRAGHTVHHIQALHSTKGPHRIGRLTTADGNTITVDFDDEVKRYRNHELERLADCRCREGSSGLRRLLHPSGRWELLLLHRRCRQVLGPV